MNSNGLYVVLIFGNDGWYSRAFNSFGEASYYKEQIERETPGAVAYLDWVDFPEEPQ